MGTVRVITNLQSVLRIFTFSSSEESTMKTFPITHFSNKKIAIKLVCKPIPKNIDVSSAYTR